MGPKQANRQKKTSERVLSTSLLAIASSLCLFIAGKNTSRPLNIDVFSSSQSTQLPSNPLLRMPNDGRRRLEVIPLPDDRRKYPSEIRYAFLGTSNTWGAGIGSGDILDRKTFAFPWLVNPNARNFSVRAGGPAYAATCTSTILGEEMFDVVVFEYYMRAHEGIATLARRIRERFPDAMLIFLMNWNPTNIHRCIDEDCTSDDELMLNWVKDHGFDIQHGGLLHPKVHQLFEESTDTWSWHSWGLESKRNIIYQASHDVGGFVSQMEAPENPKDWIHYADMFASDAHHPSKKGHEQMARRVLNIVEYYGVIREPRLGKFTTSDHCVNWFETGDTRGIDISPNGVLESLLNRRSPTFDKFALSFEGSEGWIRINNPFGIQMELYIGYMTTAPTSIYPKTQAVIELLDGYGEEPVILDVDAVAEYGNRPVHISRVLKVGIVNAGHSIVRFKEMEKSEKPFRLVSILLSTGKDDAVQLLRLPGNVQ